MAPSLPISAFTAKLLVAANRSPGLRPLSTSTQVSSDRPSASGRASNQSPYRTNTTCESRKVWMASSGTASGTVVVEQVFALPGIGKYFITAALNRDYGLVLGTTILYVFIILALNLIVDILYAWLDPKVRYR